MEDKSMRLMLSGILSLCKECAAERIFVPVDDAGASEFCCTSCDAAVFLLSGLDNTGQPEPRAA